MLMRKTQLKHLQNLSSTAEKIYMTYCILRQFLLMRTLKCINDNHMTIA